MTVVMDQMNKTVHVVVQENLNVELVNVSVKVENVIAEPIVEMEVMKLIVVSKTIEFVFIRKVNVFGDVVKKNSKLHKKIIIGFIFFVVLKIISLFYFYHFIIIYHKKII